MKFEQLKVGDPFWISNTGQWGIKMTEWLDAGKLYNCGLFPHEEYDFEHHETMSYVDGFQYLEPDTLIETPS